MKQKFTFLRFFAVLFALLLLGSVGVMAFAGQPPETTMVKWWLDGAMLENSDGDIYTHYELPTGVFVSFENVYIYGRTIDVEAEFGTVHSLVESYERAGDLVTLDGARGEKLLFVNEAGKTAVNDFLAGEIGRFSVWTDSSFSLSTTAADEELFTRLDAALADRVDVSSFDVTVLGTAQRYDLVYSDATGSLHRTHGAIYLFDGSLYYVNYDALDNSYFDADGNFSYRRGTVDAHLLSGELHDLALATFAKLEEISPEYTYEEFEVLPEGSADGLIFGNFGVVAFWIVFSVLGYLVPALCLGASAFMLVRRGKRRWIITASIASVWMILALASMLVILI